MSSSSRADSLALPAALALSLGGCMKIYPDPELPDVVIEWFENDCRPDDREVMLALIGRDTPSFRAEKTASCGALGATFADVARERYRIEGTLLTPDGEPLAPYYDDIDLRNGLDKRVYMYFGGFNNVRVAWAFDSGATCESLAVEHVELQFASPGFPEPLVFELACDASPLFAGLPDGRYTGLARAMSRDEVVAASPPSAELDVTYESFTDFGTLVMSPCGDPCP